MHCVTLRTLNDAVLLQEKLRPIDKKLQYQMDKLLRAAAQLQQPYGAAAAATANGSGAVRAAADPLSYGPNPDQLLPKVPLSGSSGGGASAVEGTVEGLPNGNGLYRPPRNIAVSPFTGSVRGHSFTYPLWTELWHNRRQHQSMIC